MIKVELLKASAKKLSMKISVSLDKCPGDQPPKQHGVLNLGTHPVCFTSGSVFA